MGNLVDLNLARNLIEELPSSLFSSLRNLRKINLSSNKLSTLPNNLRECRLLETIHIANNELQVVPAALAMLPRLMELELGYNKLYRFPEVLPSDFPSLKSLSLVGNLLTKPPRRLKSLERLDIRHNLLENMGNITEDSPHLIKLWIQNNPIKGSLELPHPVLLEVHARQTLISQVEFGSLRSASILNSPQIRHHNLTQCDLTATELMHLPEEIRLLTNLQVLILDQNSLSVLPRSIGYLKNLRVLSVTRNILTVLPQQIGQLRSLEFLNVRNNSLTSLPPGIWTLKRLVGLNASSNNLESLPPFEELTRVETDLIPSSTPPLLPIESPETDSDPAISRRGSLMEENKPPMKYLYLADNKLTDSIMSTLHKLPHLTALNLSYNFLNDVQNTFPEIPGLHELYLSGNQMIALPDALHALRDLRILHVNMNKLTNLPGDLSKCKRLETLDAGGCYLRYNVWNWPYDWHWGWNLELRDLNLSWNKRLDISYPLATTVGASPSGKEVAHHSLSDFNVLPRLYALGIVDVNVSIPRPEESKSRWTRIWTTEKHPPYVRAASAHVYSGHLSPFTSGNKPPSKLRTWDLSIGRWVRDVEEINNSIQPSIVVNPRKTGTVSDRRRQVRSHDFSSDAAIQIPLRSRQDSKRMSLVSSSSIQLVGNTANNNTVTIKEALFGIFEGHGGSLIAKWVRDAFAEVFDHQLRKAKADYTKSSSDSSHPDTELQAMLNQAQIALRRTFLLLNKDLSMQIWSQVQKENFISQHSSAYLDTSGALHLGSETQKFVTPVLESILDYDFATASKGMKLNPQEYAVGVVAYIHYSYLHVATLGNASAVLCTGGHSELMSQLHEPRNPTEVERVRKMGGSLNPQSGVLMSACPVTRAFGFTQFSPAVTAAPYVHPPVKIIGTDEILIIGSKAVWAVISPQMAADIARAEMRSADDQGGSSADWAPRAAMKIRDLAHAYLGLSEPTRGVGPSRSFKVQPAADEISITVMVIAVRDIVRISGSSSSVFSSSENNYVQRYQRKNGASFRPQEIELLALDPKIPRLVDRTPDPPCGRITLVFTDIKNSTELWNIFPTMNQALSLHNTIMRRLLMLLGGYEVKSEGDAIMAAFSCALDAVRWCVLVQIALLEADWKKELMNHVDTRPIYSTSAFISSHDAVGPILYRGLSVRMGIHTGEPICSIDPNTRRMDYNGPVVNKASRVASQADGGQIVISKEVLNMFTREDGFQRCKNMRLEFLSVGDRRLKGFDESTKLYLLVPGRLSGRRYVDNRGVPYQDDVGGLGLTKGTS